MKIGLSSYHDFLALLVRRKWWVVVPFVALSAAVALLVSYLPPTYVSRTLILVQSRDVPANYVVDLTASASLRLNQIEQTVLSRTNMLKILDEFEGRLPEPEDLDIDARVARLSRQIDITFQTSTRDGPVTSFRIEYQNANPDLAQQIADELAALFIEKDNTFREAQVYGTTDFLANELERVSLLLDESNREVAELRSQYQWELPEQLESNIQMLASLNSQLQSSADLISHAREMQVGLQSQIAGTPAMLPAAAVAAAAAPPDPVVAQYQSLLAAREALLLQGLLPGHPTVQNLQTQIDRLAPQLPPEVDVAGLANDTGTTSPEEVPNPAYQSLLGQLEDANAEVRNREGERGRIEADIARYRERVENTPGTTQRVAQALRENADLQAQFNDLRGDLREAELSKSLESAQRGDQFVVVDPANRPLRPSKPNKLTAVLGGMAASLLLAIGLAVAVDVLRQRVWTQSEIEHLWGVPVLVEIPEILTDSDLKGLRRRKLAVGASFLAGAAAYSGCLYLVYLHHDFILRQLDPIVQRLVY